MGHCHESLVALPIGLGGEAGLGQGPPMLLLCWQLAVSIDFSPLTKIHQSRCVGPPCLFLHRRRVVAPHEASTRQ